MEIKIKKLGPVNSDYIYLLKKWYWDDKALIKTDVCFEWIPLSLYLSTMNLYNWYDLKFNWASNINCSERFSLLATVWALCSLLDLLYLAYCTTVRESNLENGRVWGGDHRCTLRMILNYEPAGIDGQICVCGLYWEHKVSIQRAGWRECQQRKVDPSNLKQYDIPSTHTVLSWDNLTIKPVVAGELTHIIATSHSGAFASRNALGAADHTQIFFYITFPR